MNEGFGVDVDGGTVRARWSGSYGEFGRAEISVSAESGHEMTYTMRFPDADTVQATARVSSRDWYDGPGYGSTIDDGALDDLERVADATRAAAGDATVYTGPENRNGQEHIAERLGDRHDVRTSNTTRVEAQGADLDTYTDIVTRVAPDLHGAVTDGALGDAVAHIEAAYAEAREKPGWMR